MPHRIAKRPTKVRPIKAPKTLELKFDVDARQDYLTGFHKRKQARIQTARDAAVQRDREDRVRGRKELREKRKEDLENHVAAVKKEMQRQNRIMNGEQSEAENDDEDEEGGEDAWSGFDDDRKSKTNAPVEPSEDEAEYVDEDKYTTVTVEPMEDNDSEGLENEDQSAATKHSDASGRTQSKDKSKPSDGKAKVKKKKFRYESKAERALTRHKQKSKNHKQAEARRNK